MKNETVVQNRIRILYVLSEFMYGSKVRQLCDLVNGLDRDLFDIEVCALEVDNEAAGDVEALDVPLFQLRLYPPRSFDATRVRQFLRVPSVLLKSKYDIIHSLLYQSIFVEPFLIKTFTGSRYVYTKTNLEWENHRINWHMKSCWLTG